MKEKRFSGKIRCEHCKNDVTMQIVAEYCKVRDYDAPKSGLSWEEGPVYQMLECPACEGISFGMFYWHEYRIELSALKILHPSDNHNIIGLPDRIQQAYDKANRVKSIDVNAYGVLLGRVIELVCVDRNTDGNTLLEKLKDLSNKGEIPDQLYSVANNLRQLRNIGAHASLGELTPYEIPILDNLCRAILEYIYAMPFLIAETVQRIKDLKGENTRI